MTHYKIPKNMSFVVDVSLIEKRDIMAAEMFLCPKRRNGQSLEQKIYQSQAGVFLEHALYLQGATLNEKEFDVRDRDSYCWDVMWDGFYTEVKRCKITETRSWFSFPEKQVKTMLNNTDSLELLIVGDYEWNGTVNSECHVKWILLAPIKTFKSKISRSKFNKNVLYYNHKLEPRSSFLL
jgi:hypothetical protein